MIEPIAKIEIVGLLKELDDTLELVQNIGLVQIEDIPTIEEGKYSYIHRIHLDEKKAHLLERFEELSSIIKEILDILSDVEEEEIPLDLETRKGLQKLNPEELLEHISQISREFRRLARQKKNLQTDLESTRQYETLIQIFLPLLEKAGALEEMEQIGIILKRGESAILPIIKNQIESRTGHKTIFLHQRMPDGRVGLFIAIEPADLATVRNLLSTEGVGEYHIPREFRKKNLDESIETIRKRIEEIPQELESINEKIKESKKLNGALLRFIRILSTNRINQLKILSRLVRTHYTFVISGWVPVSELDQIKQELKAHFGDNVYIGKVKLTDLDFLHIPTLLSNKGIFRPFEILMKLLPPPKYGNLDATPFITIFFPLFFGIILGDMAYGLALLAIAGLIKWKARKGSLLADAGTVGIIAGLSTIFFGLLYGEFLGNIGMRFGLRSLFPWLHRAESIAALLFIALGIGTIHIILGFVLKAYLGFVMKHTKAVIEGIAKIFIILGTIGILIQLFLSLSVIIRNGGYALVVFGIIGVLATEGFIGLLEIFSNFGNILSYSRIMAIGLASVMLATVANKLAQAAPNIILGVIIGFSMHFINFIMGIFSPTIHSLRLHYVEFFGKFFLPSGRPFKPFKKIGEDLS